MTPRLTHIIRYPIKGLPGEPLPQALLVAGAGIEHDRRFAIENGAQAALDGGGWAPCQHFTRLTIDPRLVRHQVRFDASHRVLSIRMEGGIEARAQLDDPVQRSRLDDFLTSQFALRPRQVARLTECDAPSAYWDVQDAPLSLLNLSSVAALSAHALAPLSFERFRPNLVLDGLPPWEEMSWIGRTIRIGALELEVTAPIERCAATSVDPRTGERGESVPHLLKAAFGHLYCGVYARVVKGATVQVGAPLHLPAPARPLLVESVCEEGLDIVSLTLRARDGAPLPPFVPGQYLSVRLPAGGEPRTERRYTLSGPSAWPQRAYRITVRKQGLVSGAVHALTPGQMLETGAPSGRFMLRDSGRVTVLVAGGIGVTPLLAMLHQIAREDPERRVWLLYGARNWLTLPFKDELRELARQIPHLRIHLFFSRGLPTTHEPPFHYHLGRLSIDQLRAVLPFDAYDFYLCGPAAMMRNVSEGLLRLGVPGRQVQLEYFGQVAPASVDQSLPAEARIRFQISHRDGLWREPSQTLLDFAERLGIEAPFDCRAGTCGACRCPVRGKVHYAMPPVFALKPDEALLCCARPLENLEIDL